MLARIDVPRNWRGERWVGAYHSVEQFAMQMGELARPRDSNTVEVVTFKDGVERAGVQRSR